MMRSMLFVPGDRPERFAKAVASGADAVILDLEDSVTAARRPEARHHVAQFLRGGARAIPLWVRINPIGTPDALPDLTAVAAARPDGILLPKAMSGADLGRLDHWLEVLEVEHDFPAASIKAIALVIETARALLTAHTFLDPPARFVGYTWGAEDLASEIGAAANRTASGDYEETFRHARTTCLLMATAANVAAIDTIDVEFRDVAAVERRARVSRRDGFVGKLAIHPAQLAPIHAAFSPTDDEVAWARRVIEALSNAPGQGAVALDGRMIDEPHRKQAERILAALERGR